MRFPQARRRTKHRAEAALLHETPAKEKATDDAFARGRGF
jgi:hypothetical protein